MHVGGDAAIDGGVHPCSLATRLPERNLARLGVRARANMRVRAGASADRRIPEAQKPVPKPGASD